MVSANALTTINNTKVHIVTATEILLKYFFKAITLKFTQAASCGSRLYIFYWLTVVNFLQFIIFTETAGCFRGFRNNGKRIGQHICYL